MVSLEDDDDVAKRTLGRNEEKDDDDGDDENDLVLDEEGRGREDFFCPKTPMLFYYVCKIDSST